MSAPVDLFTQLGRLAQQATFAAQQTQQVLGATAGMSQADLARIVAELAGLSQQQPGANPQPTPQATPPAGPQVADVSAAAQAAAAEALRAASLATQYATQALQATAQQAPGYVASQASVPMSTIAAEGARLAASLAPVAQETARLASLVATQVAGFAASNAGPQTPPEAQQPPQQAAGNNGTTASQPHMPQSAQPQTQQPSAAPQAPDVAQQLPREAAGSAAAQRQAASMSAVTQTRAQEQQQSAAAAMDDWVQVPRDVGMPGEQSQAPQPPSQQQPVGSAVTIKAKMGNDLRRVTVAEPVLFARLQSTLQSLFGSGENLRITYTDEDGDSVRIATDADLREAITYATEGASHTLRLDVASLP